MPYAYGWRPDQPDQRDRAYRFTPPPALVANLPPSADLRSGFPACYDQGDLGSCTANAIAGVIQYTQRTQQVADFTASRLFIYYGERGIEHTIRSDSGAAIRDGMKVVATLGAPPETDWPYAVKKFKTRPPHTAYAAALQHTITRYEPVTPTLDQMRACLAAGFPFVCGFSVYASFESEAVAKTGTVPMPEPHEQQLGGHAVVCCGYDNTSQRFTLRNSWGEAWGDEGYFTLPFGYLLDADLASDFWTIRAIAAEAT